MGQGEFSADLAQAIWDNSAIGVIMLNLRVFVLIYNSSLAVVGAQPLVVQLLEDALQACLPDIQAVQVVLDVPVGFAFQVIKPEVAGQSFVLTDNACPEYQDDLWSLGLLGLAYKPRSLDELVELLRRAEMLERVRLTPPHRSPLTPAEAELLRLLARGLANKEIARKLGIANQTVQNGLTRVFQKLNVSGRAEAMLHYWGIRALPGTT